MDSDFTATKNDDTKLFGKIEKIFATYGFVVTTDGQKYFFHFGTCTTKPEFFKVGDEVEFVLGEDSKTRRIHAQRLAKSRDHSGSYPFLSRGPNGGSAFTAVRSPKQNGNNINQNKSCSSIGQSTVSPVTFHGPSCVPICRCSPQGLKTPQNYESYFFTQMAKPNPIRLNPVYDAALEALHQLQQHSSVSVQCCGLILILPRPTDADNSGTIACEIAGSPAFVRFNISSLKYQLEAPLLCCGAKVSFTAVWHASSFAWRAKDVLPDSTAYKGVICFLSNERLIIKQLTNNKRISVHVSNVGFADDPAFVLGRNRFEIGVFVSFVAFLNERNQPTLSRLSTCLPQSISPAVLFPEMHMEEINEEHPPINVNNSATFSAIKPPFNSPFGETNFESPLFTGHTQMSQSNAAAISPFSGIADCSLSHWPLNANPVVNNAAVGVSYLSSITPPSSSEETNSRSPHCWMTNNENWVGVFGAYSPSSSCGSSSNEFSTQKRSPGALSDLHVNQM